MCIGLLTQPNIRPHSEKVSGYPLSTKLQINTFLTTKNFQAVSMTCLTTWLVIMEDRFNEFGQIKVE